ncbi:MAG TPA: DUF2232 domain-containing protein [Dehalococcoidia bacterium]
MMSRLAAAAAAIVCGVAGGCLYLAVSLATPGALILVYMTQLPLFVAGLWFGTGAAALAGITGSALLLASSKLLDAVLFAAVNAIPVVLLVRQALLARTGSDGTLAWYPPGLLTAWLTGLALAGIGGALLLFGGPGGLHATLQDVVSQVLDRLARRPLPNRDQVAEALALLIPGVIAASWMVMAVINATLAQGLLARFGANWRPTPDLAQLTLPLWVPLALGLAAAATMLGGAFHFLGINMIIALLVPFCLAGLAVLHTAARRLSHPTMVLVCFYTVAATFGWPFLVVALVGLLESWLGLRRRLAPQGASTDG